VRLSFFTRARIRAARRRVTVDQATRTPPPLGPVRQIGAAGVADRGRGVALVRAVGDAGRHRAAGRVGRLEYLGVTLIGIADGVDTSGAGAKVAFTFRSSMGELYNFYNVERRHSHLDYLNPIAFELRSQIQQRVA
jgi:hypothetical protein